MYQNKKVTYSMVLSLLVFLLINLYPESVNAQATCGDGTCSIGQLETCLTCSTDCGNCIPLSVTIPALPPISVQVPILPDISTIVVPTINLNRNSSPNPNTTDTSSTNITTNTQLSTSTPQSPTSNTNQNSGTVPQTTTKTPKSLIISSKSSPNGQIILPPENVEVTFTPKNLAPDQPDWYIILPATNTEVTLNFAALLKNGSVLLPKKITLEKPLGQEKLMVTIPANVLISATQNSNLAKWDGKFLGPKVLTPTETCKTDTPADLAIEIGSPLRQILFNKPIEINFTGKTKHSASYCFDGKVTNLSNSCEGKTECFQSTQDGLTISANHFTQFLTHETKSDFPWVTIGVGGISLTTILYLLKTRFLR